MFDARKEQQRIGMWLERYMRRSASPNAPVVVGLSGGKDSTVTAAMCAWVLGKDRVVGISMPDAGQDSTAAETVAAILGIRLRVHSVAGIVRGMRDELVRLAADVRFSVQSLPMDEDILVDGIPDVVRWNLPPRIRMAVLYMYANGLGGRVANTSNMSESYVGYDTRWGDQCGDFSLFGNYTATEIREIGRNLGLPDELVDVLPADGLCGMTDEERWGFTYAELDSWLRGGTVPRGVEKRILDMHKKGLYKLKSVTLPTVPHFPEGSRKLRSEADC